MTTFRPGQILDKTAAEQDQLHERREMPSLERQYLGEIVQKCWREEYRDAEEVRADLVRVLRAESWEVEGDELRNFDAAG